MKRTSERRRPVAVFMAFGTKGDVYPIAAVAAAFACDQLKYQVILITHSAHQDLAAHLAAQNVNYCPVSSPPVVSPPDKADNDGAVESFCIQKSAVKTRHRQECLSIMDRIFGDEPRMDNDFILINFFALEGWSLAELFQVRCIVAAAYVVNYTAPSSFERQFKREFPLLYQYLQEAPAGKVCWKDVIHWMWPLFSEDWGSWRKDELNLNALPFTDPVTGHPMWHDRPSAPLLLYGFSSQVVECPNYWPSNTKVCGFWFLPPVWQFSCCRCQDTVYSEGKLCSAHSDLHSFLDAQTSTPLVFLGLSSGGRMGFLRNPIALLRILQAALKVTDCRFILLTAGFKPLNVDVQNVAAKEGSSVQGQEISIDNGVSLFDGSLFCSPDSISYRWLFQKCAIALHHGGSGSTAAALEAGIPQIICPLMLDQFYWAERMHWLGVAPDPLNKNHLLPEGCDDTSIREGAYMLSEAVRRALSPEIKQRAADISENISQENGVLEAVRFLKEELS